MSPANGTSEPWRGRTLHFVGVGGAGMSAYARAALALGAEASGSDRERTPFSERLREDGVLSASIGHDAANVPSAADAEVVYSSAIAPENPELLEAARRGLRCHPRAHLLGELSALKRTVAVAGTHGKTTAASMLVHILRACDLDPSWLVGGAIGGGLANAHWSDGELLVLEADESDGSMLSIEHELALLTNVELDHHARFDSLAQVRELFASFLAATARAIVLWNRPQLLALVPPNADAALEVVAYEEPVEASFGADGSRFRWRGHEVAPAVPGAHNALNAVGALEAARLVGASPDVAAASLAGFHGAGRRFERLGHARAGALVVDDYAHHPTEIAATIAAARTLGPRRLLAVFQPHLYTRTELLASELGHALAAADVVVVLDVYAARERAADHPGVSGLAVARAAAEVASGRAVYWLPAIDEAARVLEGILRDDDLCLAMGAGDIDRLARALVAGEGEGEQA